MERQKVTIHIAKINRLSKLINTLMLGASLHDISKLASEIYEVEKWGTDIMKYLNGVPSYTVINEIHYIHDTSNINDYLCTNRVDRGTRSVILKFIKTVSKLKKQVEKIEQERRLGTYEKLVEEFAYKEAKDLFVRIKNAGFLDDDFKLPPSTTRVQASVLGWSIIRLLNLPKRKSWAVIEKQWECGRIGNIPLPKQKTREIDKVKAVFPELDYSDLIPEPSDTHFKIECSRDVQMEVFLALVTHGFISKNTRFVDFQQIFGIGNSEIRKPIKWLMSIRLLTYFVYYAFGKTNSNYLEITRYCFSIKGKPLNRGTLKSTVSFVLHSDGRNDTFVGLKEFALKLASNGITAN